MPTLEVIQGLRGRKKQKQQEVVNACCWPWNGEELFGKGSAGDNLAQWTVKTVDQAGQFIDKALISPTANFISGAISSAGKIVGGSFAGATGGATSGGNRPRGAEQSGQGTGQPQGGQEQAGLFSNPKTLLLIGGAAIVATVLFKNNDSTKGDKFAKKRQKRR